MVLLLAPAAAQAGTLEGEATVDHLGAAARDGEGDPRTAGELGMRLRGSLDPGAGWLFRWDYRGREPVYGTDRNAPLRLLYLADASKAFADGALAVGLGRFPAPSVVLLPVDGARVQVDTERIGATVFAGRRAIATSRRNVPLSEFLPAAGATGQLRLPRARIDAGFAAYQDHLVLGTGSAGIEEAYSTWNGSLSAAAWPSDAVRFGGRVVASPRLTYTFTSSSDLRWTLSAADLYSAGGWVRWQPHDRVRLGADALRQHAFVESSEAPILDPSFTDLRLRSAWRAPGIGWLRARWVGRVRTQRLENRLRLQGEVSEPFAPYLRGAIEVVGISGKDQPDDVALVDRVHWRAGAGWRGRQLEVEGGVAFDERAAVPVSGLSGDLVATTPRRSVDLALFSLEAQSVAYLRGFYVARRWFAGLDLEANVLDRELRGLVQAGLRWDAAW